MRFTKKDNILGISFGKDNKMKILKWPIKKSKKIWTSKKEILKQIISGLKSVNQYLGINYKLSKIYFLLSDRKSNSVYKLLICKLIRHYHSRNKFKKV